jgi:hypothetical protein
MKKLALINGALLTCALLTVLLATSAHAEIFKIEWKAQDGKSSYSKQFTVAPGKVVEVCGNSASQDKIVWSFESEQSLAFNIHYHEGEKVTYVTKAQSSKENGTLISTQTNDYCWMWKNKQASAVTATVALSVAK